MKKLVLVIMVLVAVVTAQVELKGFTLGATLTESQKTSVRSPEKNMYLLNGTVGGIEGVIGVFTLDNGVIHSVKFIPDEDLSTTETQRLINGLDSKYGIKMEYVSVNDYSEDFYMTHIEGGVEYYLEAEHNQFNNKPYRVWLIIQSVEQYKTHLEEKQKKANSDF